MDVSQTKIPERSSLGDRALFWGPLPLDSAVTCTLTSQHMRRQLDPRAWEAAAPRPAPRVKARKRHIKEWHINKFDWDPGTLETNSPNPWEISRGRGPGTAGKTSSPVSRKYSFMCAYVFWALIIPGGSAP